MSFFFTMVQLWGFPAGKSFASAENKEKWSKINPKGVLTLLIMIEYIQLANIRLKEAKRHTTSPPWEIWYTLYIWDNLPRGKNHKVKFDHWL
jgi:hypothetical protein